MPRSGQADVPEEANNASSSQPQGTSSSPQSTSDESHSLYTSIFLPGVYGSNIGPAGANSSNEARKCVKPWDKKDDISEWTESLEGPGLIITIPFSRPVRISSILINQGSGEHAVRRIRAYVNRPHGLDFEDILDASQEASAPTTGIPSSGLPQADFILRAQDASASSSSSGEKVQEYPLGRFAPRFTSVNSISIVLSDTPSDHSKVFYLSFRGLAPKDQIIPNNRISIMAEDAASSPVGRVKESSGGRTAGIGASRSGLSGGSGGPKYRISSSKTLGLRPLSVTQSDTSVEPEKPEKTPLEPSLAFLLVFHCLLACATLTYFQPDEYWQSLEVAHRMVYGYGYLTWEWRNGAQTATLTSLLSKDGWRSSLDSLGNGPIRSVLHPLLFTPVYAALKATNVKSLAVRTIAPRLVHAGLSAIAARSTYTLARKLQGPSAARMAIFSMLTSPYYLYTATRTFSNTAEASLSMIALGLWYGGRGTRNQVAAIVLSALASLIRPTNAVLWIFIFGQGLLQILADSSKRPTLSSRLRSAGLLSSLISITGIIAILLSTFIDSAYHGRLVVPVIPFVMQNVYHSVSLFYGSHPWHWYISQGLPIVVMTALPAAVLGAASMWEQGGRSRSLVALTVWTIAAYSLLGHKEWRFLQPVVPLFHIMAGQHLATTSRRTQARKASPWSGLQPYLPAKSWFWLHVSTLPLAAYLLLFHCIGQSLTLPAYLQAQSEAGKISSVAFLMPCHSIPWQSHFNLPHLEQSPVPGSIGLNGSGDVGYMWFITCEPPRSDGGQGETSKEHRDQSDYFYDNPMKYMSLYFPSSVDPKFPPSRPWSRDAAQLWKEGTATDKAVHAWTSHIVVFDALLTDAGYGSQVGGYLASKGYREEKRIWNSLFHDDPRRRGDLIVLSWQSA